MQVERGISQPPAQMNCNGGGGGRSISSRNSSQSTGSRVERRAHARTHTHTKATWISTAYCFNKGMQNKKQRTVKQK